MSEMNERLLKNREQNVLAGGQERINKHHAQGKLTARERITLLLDEQSFQEIGAFVVHRSNSFGLENQRIAGDGVITGYGTIHGRLIYVFAQDFTVLGGSLSETHAAKICRIMDLALKNGAPIIGLNVTHEEVSSEDLGGAKTHAERSGVNHFVAGNDVE
ncbi:MAG: hypothetical protein EBR54_04205, partial [Flavobacteriia bacterium]|nr:hypothetical protein [Flavobacteriia bacterium]